MCSIDIKCYCVLSTHFCSSLFPAKQNEHCNGSDSWNFPRGLDNECEEQPASLSQFTQINILYTHLYSSSTIVRFPWKRPTKAPQSNANINLPLIETIFSPTFGWLQFYLCLADGQKCLCPRPMSAQKDVKSNTIVRKMCRSLSSSYYLNACKASSCERRRE